PGLERVHLRARSAAVSRQGDLATSSGTVRRHRRHRAARAAGSEHVARDDPEPSPLRGHSALPDARPPLGGGEGLAVARNSNTTQERRHPMRKLLGLGAVLALFAALAASAAQAGRAKHSVVNLTFATYVWQPTTVAAVKNIVDSWNKTHPSIQVSI